MSSGGSCPSAILIIACSRHKVSLSFFYHFASRVHKIEETQNSLLSLTAAGLRHGPAPVRLASALPAHSAQISRSGMQETGATPVLRTRACSPTTVNGIGTDWFVSLPSFECDRERRTVSGLAPASAPGRRDRGDIGFGCNRSVGWVAVCRRTAACRCLQKSGWANRQR